MTYKWRHACLFNVRELITRYEVASVDGLEVTTDRIRLMLRFCFGKCSRMLRNYRMKSIFDIAGRVAIVIGGTSGIGRALTLGFAQAGAHTVAAGRQRVSRSSGR